MYDVSLKVISATGNLSTTNVFKNIAYIAYKL